MSNSLPSRKPEKSKRIFDNVSRRKSLVIGVIVIFAGIILSLLLIVPSANDLGIMKGGHSVTGTIVDVKHERHVDSARKGPGRPFTRETLTVEYTVNGTGPYTFKGKGDFSEYRVMPEINSTVLVYYDVNKPENSVVEEYERTGVAGGWVLFLSLVLATIFFFNALPERWYREVEPRK